MHVVGSLKILLVGNNRRNFFWKERNRKSVHSKNNQRAKKYSDSQSRRDFKIFSKLHTLQIIQRFVSSSLSECIPVATDHDWDSATEFVRRLLCAIRAID